MEFPGLFPWHKRASIWTIIYAVFGRCYGNGGCASIATMPNPLLAEDLQACLSHARTTIATVAGPGSRGKRFFRANAFRIIAPEASGLPGPSGEGGTAPAYALEWLRDRPSG